MRIFFLFLFLTQLCTAQSIENQIFSSLGGGNSQFAYTLGEPLTQTFVSADLSLCQGFHQYYGQITPVSTLFNAHQFQLFPNPTTGALYLKMENVPQADIQIYNILGQLLYNEKIISPLHHFDVSKFADGSYLFRIQNLQGNLLSAFKFIKITH